MTIKLASTPSDLTACFNIRRQVFIEEQNIPEAEEWDGHDVSCLHYLAHDNGTPVGTARLIAKGTTAKIGRVAVVPVFRGIGLGAKLMRAIMEDAARRGFLHAELESQTSAIAFYERLGFVVEGPEYDDGSGILHRLMRAGLPKPG